jgi:hypothetical protein
MITPGRAAPFALAILTLCTLSCSSGDSGTPLATSPSVDVSGTWEASWRKT